MRRYLLIILVPGLVAGCSAGYPAARATSTLANDATCHDRHYADGAIGADPRCTPGALNRAALAHPRKTICRRRYLAKLEAPEAGLRRLKIAMMITYGSAGAPSTYVLGHVVPVQDGGSPADPKNVWPILRYGWGGALTQAVVANAVHALICAGTVTVRHAAQILEGDWLRHGIPNHD
ncbi:MAG: hypothetical protein WAL63_10785 [Solirubrobacteraceae bacterium]